MSEAIKILIIDCGLFGSDETLEQALADLGKQAEITRIDARSSVHAESHWDAVIEAVMNTDKVLTI